MSEEKTKSCVMCGKTIPAYSNFCPYCGAKQPWLEEDEVQNKDVEQFMKWYQKPVGKFISLVAAALVIYFVGSLFTLQDGPGHKTVARELNQYLFNAQDKTPYGKRSVRTAKQSKNSRLVSPISGTIWLIARVTVRRLSTRFTLIRPTLSSK